MENHEKRDTTPIRGDNTPVETEDVSDDVLPGGEASQEDTDPHRKAVEDFVKGFTKVDYLLLFLPLVYLIYSLGLLPAKPKLLVENPELLVMLTGSNTGLIVMGSNHSLHGSPYIIPLLVGLLPVMLPLMLYYVMGYRWGKQTLLMLFPAEKPKWFIKMEDFINRHPVFSLFLCFVPFSPLPRTIVIALAGVERVSAWLITTTALVFTVGVKFFYLYLGFQFGEPVAEVVKQIDKYMLWITLGLLAFVFWRASRSSRKKA